MTNAHIPLISTIAIGFCAAFACGLAASKLRLSPIVGYLIAGILIGPHTPGVEADGRVAEQLSELGILFLMFGVGLHFSVRDLLDVRRIALPGAIVQMLAATILGTALSVYWGWALSSGIMMGLALSVASTVVLLRALEERNLLQTNDGKIAIGWLIVEDIAMVLALVFIPALADQGAGGLPVHELGMAIGKVAFFMLFMLVAGKRLLPWLLMTVSRTGSRELFTLTVFAVAMGVAFGAATLFGVSLALGAFFAGMTVRESDLSHEAAERALPLQDAFAVLFFVSVGMLFNPSILIEQPLQVLLVVATIVCGKSLAAVFIVLLLRYPLKTALIVSAGLAQIGEFSFILASLGVAHGLIPEIGRDLILAGALISISLNPVCFFASKLFYTRLARHPRISRRFNLKDDSLAHLTAEEQRRIHAPVILVGHGRVGSHISRNIKETRLDLIVVDANRSRVEDLRRAGFYALAGDATHVQTLRDACIAHARTIIVAVPNPFEARRIVEAARSVRPDIQVLVRAKNDTEVEYFNEQRVDLAVMGPREVGRRMVEFLQAHAV